MPAKKLLSQDKKLLLHIDIFSKVCPLKRPRLGRGHIFQPKDNQLALLYSMKDYKDEGITGPLHIDYKIYFLGDKSKKCVSRKHGDLDNLVKGLNDAMVHFNVIADDSLIVSETASKEYADADGATIEIWSSYVNQ